MVKDCHIAKETIFLCRDGLETTRFNMGKRMLKQIPTFSGLQMITVYGELEVLHQEAESRLREVLLMEKHLQKRLPRWITSYRNLKIHISVKDV